MNSPKQMWNKVVDRGGDLIARNLFLKPSMDMDEARRAEMRRQQIMALRDRRNSEKHRWDEKGNYIKREDR